MVPNVTTFQGQIVDIIGRRIFPGEISIIDGRVAIHRLKNAPMVYIIPGLIDCHMHIESTKLSPWEFMLWALRHGTIAAMADPHEIANVLGVPGVLWMLEATHGAPFYFWFGAPSCVPASPLESAGAVIGPGEFERLIAHPNIRFGSEFMAYPLVIAGHPDMAQKLDLCRRYGKPIDGHAPGLRGEEIRQYAARGPATNHECVTEGEGSDNIAAGMLLAIREGGAARDLLALADLIGRHPDRVALCCDDVPAHMLMRGHMNDHLRKLVQLGVDPITAIRVASLNPARHYGVPMGFLQPGDPADFVMVDDLKDFRVAMTVVRGQVVYERCEMRIPRRTPPIVNQFRRNEVMPSDFVLRAESTKVRVIEAIDGKLVTGLSIENVKIENGDAVSDPERDILKFVVFDRYDPTVPPAFGFIRGMGLRRGAMAFTVMHDGHWLGVIGTSNEEMALAANANIRTKGGLSVAAGQTVDALPLPIAGLMSNAPAEEVAAKYLELDAKVKQLGSRLTEPFMTASFMGLTVIPEAKLGNRGLVVGVVNLVPIWA